MSTEPRSTQRWVENRNSNFGWTIPLRSKISFDEKYRSICNAVKSTCYRVGSQGRVDTEREVQRGCAGPTPLCLRGPTGDTTGVSIWQAFNRSAVSGSHKHWINIAAFHLHSRHCTATVRKTTDVWQTFAYRGEFKAPEDKKKMFSIRFVEDMYTLRSIVWFFFFFFFQETCVNIARYLAFFFKF